MAQRETSVRRVRLTPEFSVYTASNDGLLTLPSAVCEEPSNSSPARLLSRIVGDPYDGAHQPSRGRFANPKRPNQTAKARALAEKATEFIRTLEDPNDDADLGRACSWRQGCTDTSAESVELPPAASVRSAQVC